MIPNIMNILYFHFNKLGDDAIEVPDSVWDNEANPTTSYPYLMMMPEDLEGNCLACEIKHSNKKSKVY